MLCPGSVERWQESAKSLSIFTIMAISWSRTKLFSYRSHVMNRCKYLLHGQNHWFFNICSGYSASFAPSQTKNRIWLSLFVSKIFAVNSSDIIGLCITKQKHFCVFLIADLFQANQQNFFTSQPNWLWFFAECTMQIRSYQTASKSDHNNSVTYFSRSQRSTQWYCWKGWEGAAISLSFDLEPSNLTWKCQMVTPTKSLNFSSNWIPNVATRELHHKI